MGFVLTGDKFCRHDDYALERVENCTKVINNLLVWSTTYEEHLNLVREILECLRRHRITINRKKFVFASPSAHLCGYIISKDGVSADLANIIAVADFVPTTLSAQYSLTSTQLYPQHCKWTQRTFLPNGG